MNTDDDNIERDIEHAPLMSGTVADENKQPSRGKGALVIVFIATLIICGMIGTALYFGLQQLNSESGGNTGNSTSTPTTPPTSAPIIGVYEHAAVASDATLCSEAGAGILKDGGTSVDAAIATIFCLGVVNCHSTGLGGGGFMVVHQHDNPQRPVVIDFREMAPSAAYKEMYSKNSKLSTVGGLAVAVPGTLKGLVHAYKKFGKTSWSDLIQPAINISEKGFSIHHALAEAIQADEKYILNKEEYPGMNHLFTKSDNKTLLKEGDLLVRPELARTLKELAKRTPDEAVEYFYNSEFTEKLVDEINSYGGNMTRQDFINYTVLEYDPLVTEFDGMKVLGTPAPSSGSIFMFILNILKGFSDLTQSGLTYHRIVEAFKFAYAHRTLLGDPAFNSTVYEVQQFLLDEDTADRARSMINNSTTYPPDYYFLFNTSEMYYARPSKGTSHLSISDKNGDSVAVTTTINRYFGSKVVSESSGIILNDEMDDFSQPNRSNSYGLPEAPYNFIEPGKRPQSSTSPIIMLNESTSALVIGASGGAFITTATLLATINHLFFDYPISGAIEYPRIHHQWLPDFVEYEKNFSTDYLNALKSRNHKLMEVSSLAVVQGITQASPNSSIFAHCDSRKGGTPDGY